MTVMVLEDEQIAVADRFYIRRTPIAMVWPYDERGRMIGEHTYSGDAQIIEIAERDFITLDEAREKLWPQLRPLSGLDPRS